MFGIKYEHEGPVVKMALLSCFLLGGVGERELGGPLIRACAEDRGLGFRV